MTTMAAANGLLASSESPAIQVPPGHIGPVLLSATGRTVWWTGRVAIGLRYEPRHGAEQLGTTALRLQEALLRRDQRKARAARAV